MAQSIIRRFDDGQRQVATAGPGPILVTGGPGTGKTVALIGRVAGLLNAGISPRNLLFMTTGARRAAHMRRMLPEHLGPLCPDVPAENISGVQAAALEDFSTYWLRRHGAESLGIPGDFDVWSHRRTVQVAVGLVRADRRLSEIPDREVRGILRWRWLRLARLLPDGGDGVPSPWREILALYEEEKRRQGAIAWDELTPLAVQSMDQDPGRLEEWRQRSRRHWIVDDFQNVSLAGYRMLRLIGGREPSIAVAGDANQCIGSWRGADSRYIDQFRRDCPGARAFVLSANHRSTSRLAELAVRLTQEGSMAPMDDEVVNSSYLAAPRQGERAQLIEFVGKPGDVHAFIADEVWRQNSLGVAWQDMAVVCRRHASIDSVAPMFRSRGIPCTVMGDDRLRGFGTVQAGVALSTIHAAQGLQWKDVWVLDVTDRVMPGRVGLGENGVIALGEESRLFFVAATRACDRIRFIYRDDGNLASATRFLESATDLLEHRRVLADASGHSLDQGE